MVTTCIGACRDGLHRGELRAQPAPAAPAHRLSVRGGSARRSAARNHAATRRLLRSPRAALSCSLPSLVLLSAFAAVATLAAPALAQEGRDADALRDYAVAVRLQDQGFHDRAIPRWVAFFEDHPDFERIDRAHHHLGVCYLRGGQEAETPEERLRHFDLAAEQFRFVLQNYPEFDARDGAQLNLAVALFRRATETEQAADLTAAADAFAAVPRDYPQSEHGATALYYRAECLYRLNDVQQAVAAYRELVQRYPQSELVPDARYALGVTLQADAQYEQAEQELRAILAAFPQHRVVPDCQLRLGEVLFARGQYDQAEQLFAPLAAQTLEQFPQADYALLWQAHCRARLGQLDQAAGIYEQLPARFAESRYRAEALLAAGRTRMQLEQLPQARERFNAVLALPAPTDGPGQPSATGVSPAAAHAAARAEAAYRLIQVLLAENNPAGAVQLADQVLPTIQQTEWHLPAALLRIDAIARTPERVAEAVTAYRQFAEQNQAHELAPRALYRAAVAALGAGDHAAAREAAALLVQRYPQDALVPDALFVQAETHLLAEQPNFAEAERLYRAILTQHVESAAAPRARLRVGTVLYLQGSYDAAIQQLQPALGTLGAPELEAEAQLLIATSHREAERYDEAATALNAALAAHPNWERADEVVLALADTLRRQGQLPQAVEQLNRIANQFAQSRLRDQALIQLAEISHEQRQYDQAVATYRRIITELPRSPLVPDAHLGAGWSLYSNGDFAAAADALTVLIDRHAGTEAAARALYLRGIARRELRHYDQAIADLQAFLATQPERTEAADARFALGLTQAGMNQYEQAAATFAALLHDNPDYPGADRALYEWAWALRSAEQAEEAAALFRRLVTEYPRSELAATSWFSIGEYEESQEQWPAAIEAYAAGLELAEDPELREKLTYKLGWTYYRAEQYDDAAEMFAAQLTEFPDGAFAGAAAFFAGESHFRSEQWEEALALYARVAQANEPSYAAIALYRSGVCSANLNQWQASADRYVALLQQFPDFELAAEARYGLGVALQSLAAGEQNPQTAAGLYDRAVAAFEQVTEETNSETAARARFMIGECLFARQMHSEAIDHYLEAALGYPYEEWQAQGRFEAARCFELLQRPDDAARLYQEIIDEHPDHPLAEQAMARLEAIGGDGAS